MKRAPLLLLTIPLLVFMLTAYAVGERPVARELTVFAASSLSDALDEIAGQFEAQNPGVHVLLNYAASSQLAIQIQDGAPADIFASANVQQMQRVADGGSVDGTAGLFATNRLVVIVPADNPGRIEGLADLARPGLALVVAQPGVPVRTYTDQFVGLVEMDPAYGQTFSRTFYANVVSEEDNVRRVVAKVALGEADAGVVYLSDVTADIAGEVQLIPIADQYNVTAAYPIARLINARQPDLAWNFIRFVRGAEGQAILEKWGFGPRP